MTAPHSSERLLFYITPDHQCSYLPDRAARTVFLDPAYPKGGWLYTALSRSGFRRSGQHIYRPDCTACSACVPVRVPSASFRPRRSQRRVWNRNLDLAVVTRDDAVDEEHFELYRRYVDTRHPGGGMANPTLRQYAEFLTCPWAETAFFEFRDGAALLAVAVADVLDDGLSAVYTFFDPRHRRRALGVFAVLWLIAEARRRGLDWVYLGYWIEGCRKMRYKEEYLPQERLLDGRWTRVPHGRGEA